MAFASFFRRSSRRRPANQERQLEQAIKPVVEGLEVRLMLSTHRHRTTLHPAERLSGATIGVGAYDTGRAQEMRSLYGVDTLTSQNAIFPFFTGQGSGQSIVVIGSVPTWIDTRPGPIPGNLAQWSTEQGVGGNVNVTLDPLQMGGSTITDPNVNNYDQDGDIMTTAMIEWAHAMAPLANITVVECPTVGGVIDNNTLSLAIQEAVRVNNTFPNNIPGPINGHPPGGVVLMGITSQGEDTTTAAMFDSLFSYKYAASSSFIAAAGDFGGIPSMPASSPWVTSVGGTAWQTTGGGTGGTGGGTAGPVTRSFEIANINSGGGLSTVEGVPAFQRGLRANGRRLTTRGAIDLAMGEITPANTGGDTYWDPTITNNAPNKHYEVVGTAIDAAMFAGMVADANELRQMSGLGRVGRDLNNEIYAAAKATPGSFFDITQGNNTLYQAAPGYDLASGLGAPVGNVLIPALAGVATQNAAATVTGDFFLANNSSNLTVGNLVVPMRGSVLVNVGPQFISLGSSNATQQTNLIPLASGTSSSNGVTTTITATLNLTALLVRNLDNSVGALGTVTITSSSTTAGGTTGGGTTTTQTETLNVSITGRVILAKRRTPRVSLQITTVNSRGKKVGFGLQDVFQATIAN
jgi:subtilase family serine protease